MVKFSAILPVALVTIVTGCQTIPQPGQMTVANEQAENGGAPRQDREKPGEHLLQIASDVEARGDKESALQFYERAATMSEDPITRVKLGDAYMRAGRPEEAASAYRAALAQAPDDGQALMGAGGALMQAGKIQEGYEALAKAAPILKTGLAYNRVGVALVMLGRIPEAQTAFEEAHELDKVDADITTNLALAAVLNGQHDKAIGIMRELTDAQPTKVPHKRNLVLVMAIAGKTKEAQESIKGISERDMKTLLERAEKIRRQNSPKARASELAAAARQSARE